MLKDWEGSVVDDDAFDDAGFALGAVVDADGEADADAGLDLLRREDDAAAGGVDDFGPVGVGHGAGGFFDDEAAAGFEGFDGAGGRGRGGGFAGGGGAVGIRGDGGGGRRVLSEGWKGGQDKGRGGGEEQFHRMLGAIHMLRAPATRLGAC